MNLLSRLKAKASALKSEAFIIMQAYKDVRTPFAAKILIAITVGYLLSPIDLIPDFIPILGMLDDLVIVPLLISVSIKLIPPVVLTDARQYLIDHPQKLKKNNWFFAVVIVFIWAIAIVFAYKFVQNRLHK